MAEADDNKIGPDDPRWPARATADLLMRGVLAARVREAGGFPELVPALRRARHVRKPPRGEVPIFAGETQDQCDYRTIQRGQREFRAAIEEALRTPSTGAGVQARR